MNVRKVIGSQFSSFCDEEGHRLNEETMWIVPQADDKIQLRMIGQPYQCFCCHPSDDPLDIIIAHESMIDVGDGKDGRLFAWFTDPDLAKIALGQYYFVLVLNRYENEVYDDKTINPLRILHGPRDWFFPIAEHSRKVTAAAQLDNAGRDFHDPSFWKTYDPGAKTAHDYLFEFESLIDAKERFTANGYPDLFIKYNIKYKRFPRVKSVSPTVEKSTHNDATIAYLRNLLLLSSGGLGKYSLHNMFKPRSPEETKTMLMSRYDPSGVSFDSMMRQAAKEAPQICPDCKGAKVYRGLTASEPCKRCNGKGEICH